MIARKDLLNKINRLIKANPVTALIGPRQVGKTTLAREIGLAHSTHYFDLENPTHLSRLADPLLALSSLEGLVIIDEIQHAPELFKILRVLADRPNTKAKFLILGSASPTLLQHSSESLAGRIAYLEIDGLSLKEVGMQNFNKLWLRGGFPKSLLARSLENSLEWRKNFIRTFLERDLPQLGINVPAITMRRFWVMLAHYHGQVWNSSELARAFGMSDKTIRHYLDILTSTFVVRQLAPWWENVSKRQVKAPKIYFNDSGILHTLLGIESQELLESNPKLGASWEGFMLGAVLNQLKIQPEEAFYWATHSGAELDLLIFKNNQRIGFEFKRTTSPKITKSLLSAYESLNLNHSYLIHGGEDDFALSHNVTAISYRNLDKLKI